MSEMTLFDALNALRWLPENTPTAEIKKAELDVLEAKNRTTPEELEKAKAEYTEYNDLLNGPIIFDPNITSTLNAIRGRKEKQGGVGVGSGASPQHPK